MKKTGFSVLLITWRLISQILEITAEYPVLKMLVIHAGAEQVTEWQSEIVNKDFNYLLNNVQNLEVYTSRFIPTAWCGDEKLKSL